jgi:hypothetical protein
MKLFRTKVWTPVDVILLKWCCLLCGVIAGAFMPELVRRHVGLFALAAVLAGIKPTVAYFSGDGPSG